MSSGVRPARRPAVLLVEDDEILARLLAEILRDTADVRWASTAEEAAGLVVTARWDLVVADIELPGMSGIELVRRAKAARASLATLVLSGRRGFDDAVQAIRAGAEDYLKKPVEPAALVAKVHELVARTRECRAAGRAVVLAVGGDDDVSILTLTGGEAGGVAADRAEESRRGRAGLMSARLIHADLQDTSVGDGTATIGVIKRVIDETRPTTIYTHTPRDREVRCRGGPRMTALEPGPRAELERREERRAETRILMRELAILALVVAYVVLRLVFT